MKRTFFALAFLAILGTASFSKAKETPQLKPVISLRNGRAETVSLFAIARCTYQDGSQRDVKVETEPLLSGQEISALVPSDDSIENPVIAVSILAIGSEDYIRELTKEEGQENSFTLIKDETSENNTTEGTAEVRENA